MTGGRLGEVVCVKLSLEGGGGGGMGGGGGGRVGSFFF